MIMIDNKYEFGQVVYLKTDIEQLPRIAVEIRSYHGGESMYGLRQGESTTYHYEYEINDCVDESVKLNYPME